MSCLTRFHLINLEKKRDLYSQAVSPTWSVYQSIPVPEHVTFPSAFEARMNVEMRRARRATMEVVVV